MNWLVKSAALDAAPALLAFSLLPQGVWNRDTFQYWNRLRKVAGGFSPGPGWLERAAAAWSQACYLAVGYPDGCLSWRQIWVHLKRQIWVFLLVNSSDMFMKTRMEKTLIVMFGSFISPILFLWPIMKTTSYLMKDMLFEIWINSVLLNTHNAWREEAWLSIRPMILNRSDNEVSFVLPLHTSTTGRKD